MHTNYRRRLPKPKPKAEGRKLFRYRAHLASRSHLRELVDDNILRYVEYCNAKWNHIVSSRYGKWAKRQKAKDRRQEERRRIHHQDYDELLTHYPKCIAWEYW